MGASILVDTGALLAVLDRTDEWHTPCTETLRQMALPLLTSEAVLTELFHFLRKNPFRMEAAWNLLRRGTVAMAAIQHDELPHIRALMTRYRDRPMDFADATLVYLAQRENLNTIFTVDRNDFEAYRIHGRRRFRIVPSAPF